MAGQPKPGFYIAVGVVVVALVGLAIINWRNIAPTAPKKEEASKIDVKELESKVEAPSTTGVTTVKEYNFKSFERLPDVKGVSAYKKMTDDTVRFAINVWAGWGPINYANDGFKAAKAWKTPEGKEFKVELVLIDDPIKMRDAYTAGDIHIGWGTLDMVPLFLQTFVDKSGKPNDTRIMPRIFQQIDWSNGGDGLVVRENI